MFPWRKCVLQPFRSRRFLSMRIEVSPEVKTALQGNRPVVALESTIISHGMPYPQNLDTALSVEEIIREQGVVPATIGILDGRIKVGLNKKDLSVLSDPQLKKIKISKRDFPYVIGNGLTGGTTVSGTIIVAKAVGINIFVTGGIGGVHKDGENSLDVSADLRELGRNSILVVCSGAKSILDIEKTLEYLETEGVCVARYGPGKGFPAFYSSESPFPAPYQIHSPVEAAKMLYANLSLKLNSAIVLGVPIPEEFSIDYNTMEKFISYALYKGKEEGLTGKDVTPFLLKEIAESTKGKSLDANIALIKNNALIGAKIAQEYACLPSNSSSSHTHSFPSEESQPVIIGGSNVDSIVRLSSEIKTDGRTVEGKISQYPGGVGRNIGDALGKLGRSGRLLSAVGSDNYGDFILSSLTHLDTRGVERKEGWRTACHTAIIDNHGETRIGVGDMEIHSTILPQMVKNNENYIKSSSLVVMDGNIPTETINSTLELAGKHHLIVWFEPTTLSKASKPFHTSLWKHLTFVTPNLNELREMANAVGSPVDDHFSTDLEKLLKQVKELAYPIAREIPLIMVTMGHHGLLMVSKIDENQPILKSLQQKEDKVFFRYYEPIKVQEVENTAGAGDCTAAGFMSGVLSGLTEPECVKKGLWAGRDALLSHSPVPNNFSVPDISFQPRFHEL